MAKSPSGRVVAYLDAQAFANEVADHGIKLVHYRSLACPVGLVDQHDPRKAHHKHDHCSNGYIYDKAGEVTCLFSSNATSVQLVDTGSYTGSTVQITFPPFYDDTEEPVTLISGDRLELKEQKGYVVGHQRFTAAATGVDALQFPIEQVQLLVDANGIKYIKSDYHVRGGVIHWQGTHRPFPGTVCSVRYTYIPFWYVGRLLHEIRVAPVQDEVTGITTIERLPYSALCHRENVRRTEDADPTKPVGPKSIRGPDDIESELLDPAGLPVPS